MPKGQKRKLSIEEEASDYRAPTWESQQQFLLTVSLNKYQFSQQLREPSLRRSVLIANTLRQISLQMSMLWPPDDEDWGSMSTDTDSSLSAVISSILAALDSTIDGNPQPAPRIPLRPLENMEQQEDGSMEVMRSSYLGDFTVEDLFQDIDTSLVDIDMGVIGYHPGTSRHVEEVFLPFKISRVGLRTHLTPAGHHPLRPGVPHSCFNSSTLSQMIWFLIGCPLKKKNRVEQQTTQNSF
uniref:SERTA domain-containing protein n=1 Tax=Pundamilia nyererei TaxID=303518 RepID=A0A3B4H7H5_9CICH